MLTTTDAFDALDRLLPGFAKFWSSPGNLHVEVDGTFSFCSLFSECSAYVIETFVELQEEKRIQLFDFVEEAATQYPGSSTDLSTAVYTCFVENLTNEAPSMEIRRYLGPNSLRYFDAWQAPPGGSAT